jgi:hypothetical protein
MSKKSLVICAFFYNRPEFVKSCLDALSTSAKGLDISIRIYVDGPKNELDQKNVNSVLRELQIYSFTSFSDVKIQTNETNRGLAKSIISGVSDTLKKYNEVVVVEDDLIVSGNFLNFMHCSLAEYRNAPEVGSISGFSFPVYKYDKFDAFFHPRPTSWGWGTWRHKWEQCNWDVDDNYLKKIDYSKNWFNTLGSDMNRMLMAYLRGQTNSWAIRWALAHKVNNWYALTPYFSKVQNIGFGVESATNTKVKNGFNSKIEITIDKKFFKLPEVNKINSDIIKLMNIYNSNVIRLFQKLLPRLIWRQLLKLLYAWSKFYLIIMKILK